MGRGMTFAIAPGVIGFNAAGLLPSVQHFVKRMKWQYDDNRALNNRRQLEEAGFIALTGQDVRFLVLLWRYGRLNPDLLSRTDRDFLSGFATRTPTTNRAYLEEMTERGLAVSLQKSGEIVFEAAVERDQMIGGLIAAIGFDPPEADSLYADTRSMLDDYLQMIIADDVSGATGKEPSHDSTAGVTTDQPAVSPRTLHPATVD